jgi:O-antigen ligase
MRETASASSTKRLASRAAFALAALFLVANLAFRSHALLAAEPGWTSWLGLAGVALASALCLARASAVGPVLQLFAASFLLYGFHAYRLSSQVFELLVTALACVLLLRLSRGPSMGSSASAIAPGARTFAPFAAFALVATASLLLLPAAVLEHRLFLEGAGFARAVLGAFPKDPLYPIASVNRLWLFLLFAGLLAAQAEGVRLYRKLVRGVALAAIAAAMLGLLDFAGVLSLDGYNLSNLFYGREYRRLQSTFGNPSWFACFAACSLPFVWLAFEDARGRARMALAAAFPLLAASLFLSGARAGWLAALVLIVVLVAARVVARRSGRPLPAPDGATWLALAASGATVAVLAIAAWTTPATREQLGSDRAPAGRLEGLSREMHYRGLGLTSPRRLAAAYALELARQKPLLGLGYESYNLHLQTQLQLPGSSVGKIAAVRATSPEETVFDDSHNTYLQVLTGTGALGLTLWLALALAGLRLAVRVFWRNRSHESLAVLLGLIAFHLYGLFQGMAYIPVVFLLLPLLTGYAVTLDHESASPSPTPRWLVPALAALALVASVGYASDSGYASLKRRFGVAAYLPDEAAEYEGFYRPETGAAGEFRWMRARAIVNARRAEPFRLSFACEHPDAEREPVVLTLRFDDRDAGQIVLRRPGERVERRFDFGEPGALRLSVSRTFRPSGGDRRELGVAVSAIRWE